MSDADTDLLAEYDRFQREGGLAVLARDLVDVTGPDAGRYLQGQLSQEVVALPDGASTWSLLLQPTGKVDAWLRVHRDLDDHYVLDVDAGFGDALVARLNRFLLRTKAEIGAPQLGTMVAVRYGLDRIVVGDEHGSSEVSGLLSGPAVGPRVGGHDVVHRGSDALTDGSQLVSPATYERYRIAHGIPAMGAELTADTIPAEAGQWLIDASVSFTKGCYTGQELVARIDSRGGNVPRPVRLLVVAGDAPVAAGAEVRVDGQPVGAVTSAVPPLSAGHPGLALAPLSRAVTPGTTVEVESLEGWVQAGVVEPPFAGHGAD